VPKRWSKIGRLIFSRNYQTPNCKNKHPGTKLLYFQAVKVSGTLPGQAHKPMDEELRTAKGSLKLTKKIQNDLQKYEQDASSILSSEN